jgi:hypothetical protein
MKDVSKFGVLYVTEKHCGTSLVKEVEMQAQISQENKLGHSYESLEVTGIFLYFIHMLPDIIKISSFGFHGKQ